MAILSTSTTFKSDQLLPILSLIIINVLIIHLPGSVHCEYPYHSTNQNEQALHHYTHSQDEQQIIHYNPSDSVDNQQIDSGRSSLFDRPHHHHQDQQLQHYREQQIQRYQEQLIEPYQEHQEYRQHDYYSHNQQLEQHQQQHQRHHNQKYNHQQQIDYSSSYANQQNSEPVVNGNFAHDGKSMRHADSFYNEKQQVEQTSQMNTNPNWYFLSNIIVVIPTVYFPIGFIQTKDTEVTTKLKESCEKPPLLKTSAEETCPQKASAGYPSNSSPHSLDRDIHINDDGTIAHHQSYDNSFLGMFNAVSYYWREFATVCLLTALFLNWLFVIVKRKLIKETSRPRRQTISKKNSSERRRRSESVSTVQQVRDQNKEEHIAALTDRSGSKSNMNDNDLNLRQRTNRAFTLSDPCVNNSIWSTPPNSLSSSLNTSAMFKSRYSSDFDSIRRLGRGGFGVVFEAKNKIDDCHYAVKRICLPLEKDARERVMREVKALAKLDHSGIVRYYNAWLETPPEEWLKEHDKQFNISSTKDNFKTSLPSTYDTETDKIGLNICDFSAGAKFRKDMGDTSSSDLMIGRRKVNGYKNRLLQSNSNSQSLDVVFEGSGSIRLESDTKSSKSSNNKHQSSTPTRPIPIINKLTLREEDESDQSSESDDDMLQFSTRPRASKNGYDPEESSFSYDLTEPFSSSGEENSGKLPRTDANTMHDDDLLGKTPENDRNFRSQLNNTLITDNLHTEKAYLYIQMQLCRKDTLKNWLLTNCDKRDKTVIFDLFYQIVDAVEYVHSQDLIHRDLKPSNIFFSMDGIVKIGDFGLVTAKSTGIGSSLDLHENVAECDADRCIDAVHTEQVGTQLYMSPEQINGVNYNHKVDIFAMGLILIELLVPFKTQMQRINVLVKARNQFFSDEFRKNFPKEHSLLKSLLCRNPQKRPSASELKQHELLTNCQLSAPVIERLYQRRRTISSNSSTE